MNKKFVPQKFPSKPNGLRPAAPQMIYWPYVQKDDRAETYGTGHFHWGITAFHSAEEDGTLKDTVTIEVEAASEIEAISRAMDIIERPNYRVAWVKEACTKDPTINGNNNAT